MNVLKRPQSANEREVDDLIEHSKESLTSAIHELTSDRELEVERAWLELLLGALRQRGMLGLQEALLSGGSESAAEERRQKAAVAVREAARAARDAAGKIYHPRAAEQLRKAADAISAIGERVEAAGGDTSAGQQPACEVVALRKLAGTLMGAGASEKKLKGLAKARAARAAKRQVDVEAARLAKMRGVETPAGV